jgi:hypothetical protein
MDKAVPKTNPGAAPVENTYVRIELPGAYKI